jgi:hydrogenase expression/formation protein HypC
MCLAVPGMIVELMDSGEPSERKGKVDFGGIRKEASLAFTPEAVCGDYVLVHAGFALSVVDPAEAQRIFDTLREMDALELDQGDGS